MKSKLQNDIICIIDERYVSVRGKYGMRDYVITTDSSSDLPEEYYKEHGVGCT